MSKSLGNFFTVREVAEKYGYEPIKYMMLSAHYRSPINYNLTIIEQCKSALERLYNCRDNLDFSLQNALAQSEDAAADEAFKKQVDARVEQFIQAMDDDLNSPMVISALFDWVRTINQLADGSQTITAADLAALTATVRRYAFDILGLRDEKAAGTASGRDYVTPLVEMLLDERLKARAAKDWAASDRIRDGLAAAGIRVKDRKDGSDWELE